LFYVRASDEEMKKVELSSETKLWVRFFPKWVLANLAGFIIIFIFKDIPVIGLFVILGVFQWLVMREPLSMDWSWMLASILPNLGMATAGIDYRTNPSMFILVIFVSLDLLGLFQWLVLRQYLYRAILWVLLNPVSAIAAWAVWFFINIVYPAGIQSSYFFWLEFISIYCVLTGIGLVILAELPKPSKKWQWI
jgi:hypothetical protein